MEEITYEDFDIFLSDFFELCTGKYAYCYFTVLLLQIPLN